MDAGSACPLGASAVDILKEYVAAAKKKAILVDPKRFDDPVRLLFKESIFEIPQDRIDATRNLLLQKLVEGTIKGYSPVFLSASAIAYHKMFDMRLPEPIEPIENLGIWVSDVGQQALSTGKISWAFFCI